MTSAVARSCSGPRLSGPDGERGRLRPLAGAGAALTARSANRSSRIFHPAGVAATAIAWEHHCVKVPSPKWLRTGSFASAPRAGLG